MQGRKDSKSRREPGRAVAAGAADPTPEVAGEDQRASLIAAQGRYEVLKRLSNAFLILCAALPIYAASSIAAALAGKHTTLSVTFTISIVLTLSVSAGLVKLLQKTRKQTAELQRQRGRIEQLESENTQLRQDLKGAHRIERVHRH